MAQTQTAAKAPRGKKGDGPLTISFIDADDKPAKRLPQNVKAVVVTDKAGKTFVADISDINVIVAKQLAAGFVGKRFDTSIRNAVKKDGGDVIELAKKAFENIKAGKIFARGEGAGAGAGRPFDYEVHVEAMVESYKHKHKKAPDDKKIAAFETKLKAMTPKDRRAAVMKYTSDFVFATKLKEAQLNKLKKSNKGKTSEYDATADLF